MNIHTRPFGTVEGHQATLFEMVNSHGIVAAVTDYGATLVSLVAPDRQGNLDDITTGFESVDGYAGDHPYFGSTVGRSANRITAGQAPLDGEVLQLAKNDNGQHHLHGGEVGFNRRFFQAEPSQAGDALRVTFRYTSPDGEENYPGTMDLTVVYELNNDNELIIDYTATTDKPTLCNLTNHAYWNLCGQGAGDVMTHEVKIEADRYTPTDETLMPSGELTPVAGTPVDFTDFHAIGERIGQVPGGYDLNFVLRDGQTDTPTLAATLREPVVGRVMEVLTTEPGIQLYTGNFLDGTITGKNGAVYQKHAALCLETQHFPDAPNHETFPSTVLRPGETYRHTTIHRFSVMD